MRALLLASLTASFLSSAQADLPAQKVAPLAPQPEIASPRQRPDAPMPAPGIYKALPSTLIVVVPANIDPAMPQLPAPNTLDHGITIEPMFKLVPRK